jgi:hypothetical protein
MFAPTVIVLALAAQGPSADSFADRLLRLHSDDAKTYAIFRDPQRTERLALRPDPVYRWTNPTRVGGQTGEVFLWTYRGRPEVVASIFSHPTKDGRRVLCHELHSLSDAVLVVDRDSPNRWEPQAPGLELKPIEGAPTPADSGTRRLAQIRALARGFSGRSLSDQNVAWELRLLPQPLFRYDSDSLGVIDGALFALVSSAGTDPEVILMVEARKSPEGPRWVFGAARFSDMSLWLTHKGREVWTSIRGGENTFNHDAKHRFRFYQDRFVAELDASTTR